MRACACVYVGVGRVTGCVIGADWCVRPGSNCSEKKSNEIGMPKVCVQAL